MGQRSSLTFPRVYPLISPDQSPTSDPSPGTTHLLRMMGLESSSPSGQVAEPYQHKWEEVREEDKAAPALCQLLPAPREDGTLRLGLQALMPVHACSPLQPLLIWPPQPSLGSVLLGSSWVQPLYLRRQVPSLRLSLWGLSTSSPLTCLCPHHKTLAVSSPSFQTEKQTQNTPELGCEKNINFSNFTKAPSPILALPIT